MVAFARPPWCMCWSAWVERMSRSTDHTRQGRYVELDLGLHYTHPLGDLRPYFEALEAGRALAVRCTLCDRTWFPPRRTCCGHSPLANWTELAGTGTMLSITCGERYLPFTDKRAPMSLALVALDGADNAALGWIEDVEERLLPGSRVRLVAETEDAVHPVQSARFQPVDD